ncbi:DEAD/DEAH box helicase [Umezawaea sp. Da 62-37]|uniref:DEAD/DEAH box helicase n=1 Tax=Umezawaea sp. Da 62-37 TaxID=3075927 RepID=UPI0028F708B4|nr:DEAD/DEAH box helicase [Umezawaea sp. Da 62-37]WNV86265.1 DEAD/DEAH box helicase [Umezawaea sp. Da 62-37]
MGQDAAVPQSKDTSVAGVAFARWGVRPEPAMARYAEPGWQLSPMPVERRCPRCQGQLHGLYRSHPHKGRQQLQAAVVCPACPASFTLRELQLSQRAVLGELRPESVAQRLREEAQLAALERPEPVVVRRSVVRQAPPEPAAPVRPAPPARPAAPARPVQRARPVEPVVEPEPEVAVPEPEVAEPPAPPRRTVSTAVMAARIRSILTGSTAVAATPAASIPLLPMALRDSCEHRLVWWRKTVDPRLDVPELPPGVDARVVLPEQPRFDGLRERLKQAEVPFRSVPHWIEEELVSSVGPGGRLAPVTAGAWLSEVGGLVPDRCDQVVGDGALAAMLAFEVLWDLHEPVDPATVPDSTPADRLVPPEWLPFLTFPLLNPAQSQAAPHILDTDEHLLIAAPTGAGKTTIGKLAALRSILHEGRKAAWLVPQRSLTDELNIELEAWRRNGLRVERLSGEYAVDIEKVREADLWVATTEKFEAICRAGSLQAALGEVGCLVVDEIHLLGSPGRGALLEALLARVRGAESPVRIVGLSATVSNAAEIAEWLQATLVTTTWRPSRVTWQLPVLPASTGFAGGNRVREQAVVELTERHTAEAGSVLVFCGSKRNVRSTAMAVAASRGAPVHTAAADDVDALTKVCAEVGVRMHYADYDHKHAAERAFRSREADVLVATSTVAAGVNLPARAVVVRDTKIGGEPMDTSTVQQMFGRAGRIGAGETQGWSYLLTEETERAAWQTRLVAGYSVYSRIYDSLADHVLAEVLQARITTLADAQAWWVETLAHAQGDDDLEPVQTAVDFLIAEGHLTGVRRGDDLVLATTELGRLTARMMVSTYTGQRLRRTLGLLPVPRDPDSAEESLSLVLAVAVPELAGVPVAEQVRPAVATAIKAGGRTSRITHTTSIKGLGSSVSTSPGDLAWAALLLAARSPHLFREPRRVVAGIPLSTIHPVMDQAPRYLSWLAAQGVLGTVHPWIAIVAADLDQRLRWRHLAPHRGSGRLLWLCEQMATRPRTKDLVPAMWRSAVDSGLRAPDWNPGVPPRGCELDQAGYTALLRDRATGATITERPAGAVVSGIAGATAITWRGKTRGPVVITSATTDLDHPPDPDSDPGAEPGVAVFTRRGDYRATGWLATYDRIAAPEDELPPPRRGVRKGFGARG